MVPELSKPINQWCPSCAVGSGCRGYGLRPESCQKFECIWLSRNLDPKLRPDRCKVVFELLPEQKIVLALVDPHQQQRVWSNPAVIQQAEAFVREGLAVVDSSQRRMKAPRGRSAQDVWDGIKQYAEKAGLIKVDDGSSVVHE